jgi:hypothetical protein
VVPYRYEDSAEASWMCLVVHVGDWSPAAGARPELTFDRLDIALADFKSRRRATPRRREQLLQWTVWPASRPRTRLP